MANIFNKIFYNKDLIKKAWRIEGSETDITQDHEDDNIKIDPLYLNLIITKEKDIDGIMATIQVKGQEYNFMLYDEIIDYINGIREVKK